MNWIRLLNRTDRRTISRKHRTRSLRFESLSSRELMAGDVTLAATENASSCDLDWVDCTDWAGQTEAAGGATGGPLAAAASTAQPQYKAFSRGVVAVLLSRWSAQSVSNFLRVVTAKNAPAIELAFAPHYGDAVRQYDNALTIVNALAAKGKSVRLVVHLGFHETNADHLPKALEGLRSFLEQTVTADPLQRRVINSPFVRLVVSPSLEDKFANHEIFDQAARAIAQRLPAQYLRRIALLRSSVHDTPGVAEDIPSRRSVSVVSADGIAVRKSLRHEYHGDIGDADGYQSFSNDGVFVRSGGDLDGNGTADESSVFRYEKDHARPTIETFDDLPAGQAPPRTILLWRPAYNLHEVLRDAKDPRFDIEGYDGGSDAKSRVDENVAFNSLERRVLRQFLGLAPRPAPPRNVRLIASSPSSVSLRWDPVGGEIVYHVAQSRDGVTWQTVATTTAAGLDVKGLAPVSRYLFRVQASDDLEFSDESEPLVVITPDELPAAPANLQIANLWSRVVDLSWEDRSHNESEFRVEISRNQGQTWESAALLGPGATSARIQGLVPNTPYWFRVLAVNSAGTSNSNVVSIVTRSEIPVAPINLRAANVWSRTVDLNWSDVSSNEDGFIVSISTDGNRFDEAGRVAAGAAAFRAGGLAPNTRYWFRVAAYNSAGPANSVAISVATLDEAPTAPVSLRAANVWTRTIDLNWLDTSHNELGFVVQMSTDGSRFTEIGRTVANHTSFRVTGLRPNTRYLFRIVAYNSAGNTSSSVLDVRTRNQ